MPSAMDQLSKLTGTTLICVAMVFILPSLGGQSKSELRSNMATLAIFVVTVVGNICIQFSTGVIVLFIPEHVIIMFSMLLLLVKMGDFYEFSKSRLSSLDDNYSLLVEGEGTLLQRLKVCYVKAYRSSTQFLACHHPICAGFNVMSLLCSITLIQAIFRSVIFKQLDFCSGNSDYDWSMRLIVISQICAVVVGASATTFRWLSVYQIMDKKKEVAPVDGASYQPEILDESDCCLCMCIVPNTLIVVTVWLVWWIPSGITRVVGSLVRCLFQRGSNFPEVEDFKHQNQDRDADLDTWLLKKRVARLNNFIAKYKKKLKAPTHLITLFLQTSPSQQFQVSNKSMLLSTTVIHAYLQVLVGVAEVSLPSSMHSSISEAYHEARLLFRFISDHYRTYPMDYSKQLPIIGNLPESVMDRAIFIITKLRSSFSVGTDGLDELSFITRLINPTSYSTMEELSSRIEQLFVDLAHALLAQFPNAVFKLLGNDDPFPDNFEKKAERAIKMIYMAKEFDGHIQWSFPMQWNISRLASPILQNENDIAEEENIAAIDRHAYHATGDDNEITVVVDE